MLGAWLALLLQVRAILGAFGQLRAFRLEVQPSRPPKAYGFVEVGWGRAGGTRTGVWHHGLALQPGIREEQACGGTPCA